ncbi:hypothetical protein LOTGIDRAFT_172890 [Lottia gigantea]|uniref:Sushi domain-containing protein n=1 Tax=Lottia gigantea TaxID=225164 RepID=V4AUH6_LOTGI|nr:hypothetical protein LOTGIDRAFT_172890 [Lottia gigantea]ESP00963.1 hypothetical protein LOTGIDRAFT_172890 [Lottia gigantea]
MVFAVSGCKNLPRDLPKAHLWYVTNTSAVYRCSGDYSLNSGNLVRTCINGSWTGIEPLCTAEGKVLYYISLVVFCRESVAEPGLRPKGGGILPKTYMVLLIVGGIVFLFLICIPVDFYRYRKRKKVCRERRERMEMMTRIEPLHANLDRNVPVVSNEVEQGQAKFSFRSILSFFRLVKNTRKRHDQRRALNDQSRENSPPATLDVIQSAHSNGLANLSEVDECADNGAVGSDNTEMTVPSSILVSSPNDNSRQTSCWSQPQQVNFSPTSPRDTSFSPTGMPFIESPSHSSPNKSLLIDNTKSNRSVKDNKFSSQESPRNDCFMGECSTNSLQGKKYERINLISESPLMTVLKSKRFRQSQLSPLGESSTGSNRLPDLPTNVD